MVPLGRGDRLIFTMDSSQNVLGSGICFSKHETARFGSKSPETPSRFLLYQRRFIP